MGVGLEGKGWAEGLRFDGQPSPAASPSGCRQRGSQRTCPMALAHPNRAATHSDRPTDPSMAVNLLERA